MKLTPRQRKALQWFAEQTDWVGWFDLNAPSRTMINRLHDKGLIWQRYERMGLIEYRISDSGREALTR